MSQFILLKGLHFVKAINEVPWQNFCPRFHGKYRGKVLGCPGCPGGVGTYACNCKLIEIFCVIAA